MIKETGYKTEDAVGQRQETDKEASPVKADLKDVFIAVISAWLCIGLYKMSGVFVRKVIANTFAAYFVTQLIQVMLAFICARLLSRNGLFRTDRRGRWGWVSAMPMILLTVYMLYTGIPLLRNATVSAAELLLFIGQMLLIGLGEETIFRGIVQRTMHEFLGETGTGRVIAAVMLNGIVFGVTHLYNSFLSEVSLASAASQAVLAAFIGMYLGAIYFRTGKNLVFVALVHGLYDMAAMINGGRLSGNSIGSILDEAGSVSYLGIVIEAAAYLLLTLIVLRPGRTAPLLKTETAPAEES